MIHRDVPYDAEIEYLQSTDNNQYIDTGIGGLSLISFDITMSLYEETSSSSYDYVFGMWPTTTSGYGLQILLQNSGIVAPTGRNSFSLSGISAGTALTVGQKYSFTVNQTRTTSSNTFYLFARNYGNVAQATAHHYRIYALKIRQGGNVVRDFIPVRVGDEGYMYDKVSGQLFGNSGTGSFVLGPDVAPGRYANEVAFLESWGNQYIDTGIKPSTDTKIELKCLYCKSGAGLTNYGALIGADDRENAYILNHSAVANFTYGLEFSNNFANPQTRLLTFDSTASPQNMRVYDEGGSLVTTLTCLRGVFEVNQNLYLFATNRNGTPVYGSNRILYCKIYDGDTLVRDYVPVEYNGIGYMYDKVSGLFFDNKGTGKFLFGSIAKACARSYTRRQLMMEIGRPYDAEIEYLQSSGTQYINTEFVPNNQSGFYIRVYCTTSGGNHMAFGCRQTGGNTRWLINFARTLEMCWNTYQAYEDFSYERKWLEIENNFLNNRLGKVDGVTVRTSYPGLAYITCPAYIFACDNNHSINYPFTGRISNVKISQGNEVRMDFIPVRVGTTGYMYDRVSGKLFGNAGTGNFILGPDK